jgi:small subunit ribosomal protein S5
MLPGKADWSFNMPDDRNRRRDSRGPRDEVEKQFEETVISVDRVARVVMGGRRFRFRALVVIGDKKGKVGVGIAKGVDVTLAVSKAVDVAKKKMITVSLYKDTIPHDVEGRLCGAHVIVKPASSGTGIIAGGVARTVLESAGIRNALSKSLGSSNKVNIAYATLNALASLQPVKNWVVKPKPANIKSGK